MVAAGSLRERAATVRPRSSAEYRAFVRELEAREMRPAYGDLVLAENEWVWAAVYGTEGG